MTPDTSPHKTQTKINTKVPFRQSIALRVLLGLLLFDTVLILGIVSVMDTVGTQLVVDESTKLIEENGNYVVSRMAARLGKIEALTSAMANAGENLPRDPMMFRQTIRAMLDADGDYDVAGGGIWFEPGVFEADTDRYSFFWGRDTRNELVFYEGYNAPGPTFDPDRFENDPGFRRAFLDSPGYHNEEWYVVVRHLSESGRGMWSGSYMDPYSYQPMVTVTVALHDADQQFIGVATVDLKLEGLQAMAHTWAEKTGGYLFLLDRNNRFITFPRPELAKVYAQDSRGKRTEEFHTVAGFAAQHPEFQPIAAELESLNQQLIQTSHGRPYYSRALVEHIHRGSYQIDPDSAELITAVLLDPYRESLVRSNLLHSVHLDNDMLLSEPVTVSVFHVPGAYWKAVIVKPRSEYSMVANQIQTTILRYILVIGLIIFVLGFSYQYSTVVRPIQGITDKAAAIGSELQQGRMITDMAEPLVEVRAQGEIRRLSKVFNQMTLELIAAQRNLQEINRDLEAKVMERTRELEASQAIALQNAHAAGMAEIATGVLHNIGNVLNSLNVSVEELHGELSSNHLNGYLQACEMLEKEQHQIGRFLEESERGRMLLKYLMRFGVVYEKEVNRFGGVLAELREKVEAIKQIISTQHIYAKGVDLYEDVNLEVVIEDALNLEAPSLKAKHIRVVRDFQAVPDLRTSKVKLMHIFINLIKNGREALMADDLNEDKTLTMTLGFTDAGLIEATVVDNGVGIRRENLNKIFCHGFTTKNTGNGFGLHFCANAARELGGELTVLSSGPGGGAVFRLVFGLHKPFVDQLQEEIKQAQGHSAPGSGGLLL
ncbi:PDC sensor domain-containing protein [Acanthopleuribacter pedis]|uniref:Signal transduction histidine-protein kinase/phosphatase MprB n=1 Tax=Acanthopleuribacter pedis TaxID=442870 RepID=A0A8J7QHZ6_9BACT|nr:ATP-binding protein [Acanthopleuribacter pedis]MBO1320966.1 HAMP domain-containing protein [Acanthopleuribacter pedis]